MHEQLSWLTNSNSIRIHLRQTTAGNSKCIYSRAHGSEYSSQLHSFLLLSNSATVTGNHPFHRKNPHAHKNKIGTSTPPSKKTQNPPLKGGILWAWGFSGRKNQKIPGAHKIGAAISGPRIAGGNFMAHHFF